MVPQHLTPRDNNAMFQWFKLPFEVMKPGLRLPSPPNGHLNAVHTFYAQDKEAVQSAFQKSNTELMKCAGILEVGQSSRQRNDAVQGPEDFVQPGLSAAILKSFFLLD